MGLSETLRLEASQEVPHIFALDLRPLLTDFYIFECYLEYRGFLRVLRWEVQQLHDTAIEGDSFS